MTLPPVRTRLLALLVVSAGCVPDAPLSPTRSQRLTTLAERVTTHHRVVATDAAGSPGETVASVGVLGSGPDAATAATSRGSLTRLETTHTTTDLDVVGQTTAELTLLTRDDGDAPGPRRPDPAVPVSLVQSTQRTVHTVETHRTDPGPAPGDDPIPTSTFTDEDVTTEADLYGVALGKHLVRLELDQLWDDLDALGPWALQLLTRPNPEPGASWPDPDGRTLYVAQGPTEVDLPDVGTVEADEIALLATTGPATPEGRDVFGTCLRRGLDQVETGGDDPASIQTDVALLDPGCTDTFRHARVGTEWWYDHSLVAAEYTEVEVTIHDHGYEWYTDTGTGWVRQTSPTRDAPSARLFLEYSLTVHTVSTTTTAFTP